MASFLAGDYPITIRINRGILLVQCVDLGITVSRNFDLIHGSKDVGDLYFDVFKRVSDEVARRTRDGKSLPSPNLSKVAKEHEERFDLSISEAAKITGFAEHIVRRLPEVVLPLQKTPKGHRRYRKSDLTALLTKEYKS